MTMAIIWTGMVFLSVVFGIVCGTIDAVGSAAMEGAAAAVELCLSMAGIMCLWNGIMSLMNACGLTEFLNRLFRPLLSRLMPRASRDSETLAACLAISPATCWDWAMPPHRSVSAPHSAWRTAVMELPVMSYVCSSF